MFDAAAAVAAEREKCSGSKDRDAANQSPREGKFGKRG
jgi:hypothetical protein